MGGVERGVYPTFRKVRISLTREGVTVEGFAHWNASGVTDFWLRPEVVRYFLVDLIDDLIDAATSEAEVSVEPADTAMKILTIERPINATNPYAFETGRVEGDDPDAEGYEQTFLGHIDPKNPEDVAFESEMRASSDAIYEVDNLIARTNSFRVK